MIDPAEIGRRVLANLDAGRARQHEQQRAQAALLEQAVLRAELLDRTEGRAERGRAGRIARRLARGGTVVTDRRVLQIIRKHRPSVSSFAADDVA